ncbi:MAG TPA: thiol peroxidase [Verrucomicrobia bacterium]|nr:thiol peroxidase [Verrucomicrobiota bacterium]
MATITFKGTPINTLGTLPENIQPAPAFEGVLTDLSLLTLADLKGKTILLNIFPSIDTGICAMSTQRFNQAAGALKDTVILCVSMDLPFALNRFCNAEKLETVKPLSVFRSSFGTDYGVTITDGPLKGLLSRAVVVINPEGNVVYTEQVPEIAQEPDYDAALAFVS